MNLKERAKQLENRNPLLYFIENEAVRGIAASDRGHYSIHADKAASGIGSGRVYLPLYIYIYIYQEIPPKVEYSMTDLGKSFVPVIRAILVPRPF